MVVTPTIDLLLIVVRSQNAGENFRSKRQGKANTTRKSERQKALLVDDFLRKSDRKGTRGGSTFGECQLLLLKVLNVR